MAFNASVCAAEHASIQCPNLCLSLAGRLSPTSCHLCGVQLLDAPTGSRELSGHASMQRLSVLLRAMCVMLEISVPSLAWLRTNPDRSLHATAKCRFRPAGLNPLRVMLTCWHAASPLCQALRRGSDVCAPRAVCRVWARLGQSRCDLLLLG